MVVVYCYFVGNKAKGCISKQVFQKNKARQLFRKNEHFLPLKKCSFFSENLACFVFLKHPFLDSSFCLITDELEIKIIKL